MVIVLRDGEEVHGIIEWYDRNCIKVNREDGEPNLMIYKPAIKYMLKRGRTSDRTVSKFQDSRVYVPHSSGMGVLLFLEAKSIGRWFSLPFQFLLGDRSA